MIHAYAAQKPKDTLSPFDYEEKIGDHDVLVSVDVCGICHSDVHLLDGDWGDVFPLVPGHEVVGKVEKIGSAVSKVSIGDRVGIGWNCDCCHDCEYCDAHKETFCKKSVATCMGHFGGFADKIVANEEWTIKLPEGLDSAATAPLFCGGITVFSPLLKHAKPGKHVAVVGIGGLGHLGLQFAKALGCKVTAISHTPEKEADAKSFGADNFVTSPEADMYDIIINTTHANLDYDTYMGALRAEGVLIQVGVPSEQLKVAAISFIDGNKSIEGNGTGTPDGIRQMLELCAKHDIKAQIQEMPMSQVNEAIALTRENKARYRVVLRN